MPPSKQLDPAEFARTLQRVRDGKDVGMEDQRCRVDSRQLAEIHKDRGGGRSPAIYRKALEYHGFKYVPAMLRAPDEMGRPHLEGEWRHNGLRFALGEFQLTRDFPGGPQQLDTWLREMKAAKARSRTRLS